MTEVVIRNKGLLERLNSFSSDLRSIPGYDDSKYHAYSSEDDRGKGESYCTRTSLDEMLARGNMHSGYPEQHFAQPVSWMAKIHPEKFESITNDVRNNFASEIGAMHSALFSLYPPGGFVGWHTNWNANCYQVLFTWSETGDGYFKYYDKQKDEIVTIQDVPGWQCRHYYFGRQDEPDHHCWHAAYAGCERITLAYKFINGGINDPMDPAARMMRDQLIEEIESED